jgi:U2 small nuclear ribonucleoprotein A'
LSTGQIPAEFAMPKPDPNMAEAPEEADKMETDGQNQEGGQKQIGGNTPIEEVY